MKVKTSALTNAALNYLVAQCEGYKYITFKQLDFLQVFVSNKKGEYYDFNPAKNWSQGGPIIEREIDRGMRLHKRSVRYFNPGSYSFEHFMCGDTTLIAAMRCFVASRLGDKVEIPEELK